MMHNRMLYGYQNTTAIVRDPVTIGTAILTAIGVTGAGTFVAGVVGYLATSLVTSWALRALAPKPSLGSANSAGILVNAKGPAEPQQFVYGQIRKGGVVTYYETTPVNENKFLHQIIVLAGHEVDEIGDIYINDEVATFDGDFVTGEYESKLRIQKFRGDQTTAPASLDEESNQINANFVGRGIAYLYVRYEYDQDVFANGIPLITAVVKGKRVFDPRTGTTAFSSNAALCVRDYLTSAYGMNTADVDDTAFSVAANVCDEAIPLVGGGTEPRYSLNGLARADQKHSDVLANMMTACAGTLFWGGGKFILRAGAYTAPTKVLTLDDLRSQISIDTRTNLRDQFNYVQGTFNDAGQRWITVDYPPFESSVFQAEDGGDALPLDLELPMTTSGASAQRIAKLTLFRGREQMTMTADFGLNALDVEVGEIIAFTNPRYGFDQKEFEVVGWRFGPNQDAGDLRITLSLRETSEAAFDWNAEESAIISNNTNLPSAFTGLEVNNLTASGGGRTQGDGTFINSVILNWDAAQSAFVDNYEVEYRPVSDSNFASTTTVETSIELSPVVDSIEYIFRVRSVSVLGVKGPITSVLFTAGKDTTAPNPPSNLAVEAGYKNLTVTFDLPTNSDFNKVEVFESTSSSFGGAVSIGFTGGNRFVRTGLGNNQTRFYFVRSIDFSGNASAFVGPESATTFLVEQSDLTQDLIDTIEAAGVEPVNSLPASGDFDGQIVFLLTDNTLYRWDATGGVWSDELFTDIKDNSVTSEKLVNLAVNAAKVADNAITVSKIVDDAVTTAKIAANAVTATEIASLAVTAEKVANNAVTVSKISANAVTEAKIADGAATNAKIATSAITTTKIASDAITTPKIAAGAVTAGEIAAGAIVAGKISANAVTTGTIAANAVTAGTIAANAVTATEIAADSITSVKIAASAVTADTIAANAVTAGKIAASAVTAGTIAANAVVAGKIAANAVTASEIAAGAVTASEIAANAVTAEKINALAVSANKIAAGAIVTDKIAAGAIVASKIAAGAVTADKISVSELSAITAVIGTFSSASTGERVVIEDDRISVFDSSNVLRVRIGRL